MLNLADHSSHAVMKAIARTNDDDWPDDAGIITRALESAESEVASHDYSATAFLPRLQIVNNKESSWFGLRDADAEIYVVSLALDLSGDADVDAAKDSGGAPPEEIDFGPSEEIFDGVTRTASDKLIVRSTPLFNNIRDNDYLPLLGDGIVLYGPKDPNGLLEIHTVVMEDDKAYRDLGQTIEDVAEEFGINDILDEALSLDVLSLGAPQVFAIKTGFNLLFGGVVAALKRNKDDPIQDFHFSALAHQDYQTGIHPFNYRNANGHLKIDVEKTAKQPNS